jgi:hypothetical protein
MRLSRALPPTVIGWVLTEGRVPVQSAHIESWLHLELGLSFKGAFSDFGNVPGWVLILIENLGEFQKHVSVRTLLSCAAFGPFLSLFCI